MSGIRVLVVDDEPQIHRVLRPALTACGYEVLEAATGRDALKIIATSAPDMVVLDLGLPDMDGKDVLRQARTFSKVPIVILSARDREAEKISALDSRRRRLCRKAVRDRRTPGAAARRLASCFARRMRMTTIESAGLCIDLAKHLVTKNGAR